MADPRQSEISRLELLFAAHPEGRVFTHLAEAYRRAGEPERARVLLETGLARHADYADLSLVVPSALRQFHFNDRLVAADTFSGIGIAHPSGGWRHFDCWKRHSRFHPSPRRRHI